VQRESARKQASAKNSQKMMRPVGDRVLDDLVSEEYRRNAASELQRFQSGERGSNWFGKILLNPFSDESKSEFDF